MKINGYIETIKYVNPQNHYGVFSIITNDLEDELGDEEVTCVGIFKGMEMGDYVELEGEITVHPSYGPQFKFAQYRIVPPKDSVSVERYLASGAIKGIKAALAVRIVKMFGEDTFRVMEQEPELLAKVKGISARKAQEIAIQVAQKKDIRDAMIYLQNYGISNTLSIKIFEYYGISFYNIIQTNPYKIAEDIPGVGFKTADEIAARMGIAPDAAERMKSGICYCLHMAAADGHTYLPWPILVERASNLLQIPSENLPTQLDNLALDRQIVIKRDEEQIKVFIASMYYEELACAVCLKNLTNVFREVEDTFSQEFLSKKMDMLEKKNTFLLDALQREAVLQSVLNGVSILSGGPGTGKTTTIHTMIQLFMELNLDVILAAPTGRAAKRMTEATGYEAKTIHRLLEVAGAAEGENEKPRFNRNADNPLEADVIIIDEMSMVDIHLFYALLSAISEGTRLIMAGDVNQLPSVGPGNVLKDLIRSNHFKVVILEKIFRQENESDIIVNAHKINKGEKLLLDNKSKDFFFLQRDSVPYIYKETVLLTRDKIPKYVKAKRYEIQVLTPMRKGPLGVETLNKILQEHINPPGSLKQEYMRGEIIFRVGDKVMQMKNNYNAVWEIKSKNGITIDDGTGVFNGDVGVIKEINHAMKMLTVLFDDNREVEYPFASLDEIDLAYAITIHKAQGSEYPAVIIPLLDGPQLLFNRNLLYTGVTRASKCVVILGSREKLLSMIDNVGEQKRYTDLCDRINEVM